MLSPRGKSPSSEAQRRVLLLFSSSAVDQPCLDPQSTCCQELGGAAQVFHRSPQLVGG